MKAAIYERYGSPDVVRIADVEKPGCKGGEVLVRVHAATVSTGDWRARSLDLPPGFGLLGRPMFGFFGPRNKVLGADFAGVVAEVGAGVAHFAIGDAVFGSLGYTTGTHAEFVVVSAEGAIAKKPDNIGFAEAAAMVFGGTTALNFLRDKGKMTPGESLLVNGASGAVGSAAVQIAKVMGLEVTAVCSGVNAELVTELGAGRVIDYKTTDFAGAGTSYDAIMDTVGNAPFNRCRPALKPGGRLLAVLGGLSSMLMAPWYGLTSDKKVLAGPAEENRADMAYLAELASTGRFRSVIDSIFSFEDIVAAHRRVDTGHKRGNVVLSVVASDAE